MLPARLASSILGRRRALRGGQISNADARSFDRGRSCGVEAGEFSGGSPDRFFVAPVGSVRVLSGRKYLSHAPLICAKRKKERERLVSRSPEKHLAGALAGWRWSLTGNGVVVRIQVATSKREFDDRDFVTVDLALNDRQLRSLTRDMIRATDERGLTLGSKRGGTSWISRAVGKLKSGPL